MPAEPSHADTSLKAYDAQNSREGLFARYCHGRLTSIRERHMVTLAGSVALMLLVGPAFGAAVLLLALAGDLLDCAVLARLARRYPGGAVPRAWRRISTATAVAHAGGIALSVAIVWLGTNAGDARFLAIAYLFGSALTAGLTLVHNPPATIGRMIVYFGAAAALLAYDLVVGHGVSTRFRLDLVAVGIFAYMIWVYVRVTATGLRRRIAYERALLVERLQVEAAGRAARASEERARLLALVAEHASDGVVITDGEGRIEFLNDTFLRMTGMSADEMVGQDSWNLLVGPETDPETVERIATAMAEAQPLRVEVLSYPKSGPTIWVELNLTPILDEDGRVTRYINVGRDISDAKRREAELSRARIAAEEASQAKSSFLATMSHEIRTPMNAIIGMADLLSETPLEAEQKTYVSTITEAGEALLIVIGDVLEATRLETGQFELVAETFDLHGCIRGVARLLETTAGEKGLRLEVAIAGDCPVWVRGDGGRVRQILLNLVGNAVKFTERGFVSIRAGLEPGGGVAIAVQDSGIGIRGDRLAHIFESFVQEDAHVTRRFGGTGLGLTISRMLVHAMGGKIDVSSRPGAGSTFTVHLALPAASAPAEDDNQSAAASDEVLRDKRILVAEDNKANRLLIQKLLARSGACIRFAGDGVEAVAVYREFAPDAILMDMSMPRMDGIEATREIVGLRGGNAAACPIIGLTANAFAEDRERCIAAGMSAFLSKPVRKDTLLSCLAQAVSATNEAEPPRSRAASA